MSHYAGFSQIRSHLNQLCISHVNVTTASYPTTSTTVGMVTTTPSIEINTTTLTGEGIVIASLGAVN